MSDIAPEDAVQNTMHRHIKNMLAYDEDIRAQERTLAETKRERTQQRDKAERMHRALLALEPSTEVDFDKYVNSFKRANPR